jgi:hypothetical protein
MPTIAPTPAPTPNGCPAFNQPLWCRAGGDPTHYAMFARDVHGKKLMHHYQGYGELELVDAPKRNFRVNACNQRRAGRVGAGIAAVAVASANGRFSLALPSHDSSSSAVPPTLRFNGSVVGAGAHGGVQVTTPTAGETQFLFPGGESVTIHVRDYVFMDSAATSPSRARILDVQTSLPGAQYCGKVRGLCGCFDPDSADSSWCNAAGQTVAPWNGPWDNSRSFAQTFGDTYQPANSLFALDGITCDSTEPADSKLPSHLFEACPRLQQKAEAQCPKGTFRDWCVVGAGLTCQDLSIENARATATLFGGRWGDAGIAAAETSAPAAAPQILNKDTTLADLF